MKYKRINFNVPVEVHRGFKIWCAENGTSMKDDLLEVVNKRNKTQALKRKRQ